MGDDGTPTPAEPGTGGLGDDGTPKPDDSGRPDDPGTNRTGTVAVSIGAAVAAFVILLLVFALYTACAGHPAPGMCSTTCVVFVKLECPGDRSMGLCAGVYLCDQPVHRCGANPP